MHFSMQPQMRLNKRQGGAPVTIDITSTTIIE